jgi:tetratricopeptide (TPR) repeat protein
MGHDKEGRNEQAEQAYRKAIAVWERMTQYLPLSADCTPRAYWCSAVVYSQELAEYTKGIEYYQHILDNWPDYKYAWHAQFLLGRYYEKLQKTGALPKSEAEAKIDGAYEAVIEEYPHCRLVPGAALKLGRRNFKRGQWPDAAHYLGLFVQKHAGRTPNHVFVTGLYDLARSYEKMGDSYLAAEVYRIFVETADPDDSRLKTAKAKLKELEGADK